MDMPRHAMFWKAKDKCYGDDCQVAWDYVCRLRSEGGLGITDLGLQNKCLLLKVLHGLFSGRDSPWTRWVKRSYLGDHPQAATPAWRRYKSTGFGDSPEATFPKSTIPTQEQAQARRRSTLHATPMAPFFLHPEGTATSIIASSHTLPLLAAGTVPAPGVVPSLTILHSWTGAPGAPEAFTAVDCFSTTAPFRSISWSKPSSSTSSAGFVAGGLEDGGVALWDSKIVRDSVPEDSAAQSDEIDANYFAQGHRHRHQTAPSHHTREPEPVSDGEMGFVDALEEMYESDGRGVVFGNQAWKPPCLEHKRDNIVRSKSPATEDGEAVAFFRHRNRSPVNGLSFNQVEPHLLASAAADRLVVWDLSYTRGPIDSWEHISSPSTNITSVSWSRSPDMIGSSSDTGLITLFDIRDKLPCIR
ncbi:hypothetical protein ACQ4PT_017998 [Festuca glaucescens]